MGEVAHANALRAQAVRNGPAGGLRRPCDDFAGAKTLRRIAGQLGFNAKYFGFGTKLLYRRGDATEEAASRDG